MPQTRYLARCRLVLASGAQAPGISVQPVGFAETVVAALPEIKRLAVWGASRGVSLQPSLRACRRGRDRAGAPLLHPAYNGCASPIAARFWYRPRAGAAGDFRG
jgi:hypothetical protein